MPKSEFINKEPAAGCIENAHHRHSEDLASEVCRLVELLSSTWNPHPHRSSLFQLPYPQELPCSKSPPKPPQINILSLPLSLMLCIDLLQNAVEIFHSQSPTNKQTINQKNKTFKDSWTWGFLLLTHPCLKMRPAPRALWPTSLFPISSSVGNPTAGPCAFNSLHRSGAVCNNNKTLSLSPHPPSNQRWKKIVWEKQNRAKNWQSSKRREDAKEEELYGNPSELEADRKKKGCVGTEEWKNLCSSPSSDDPWWESWQQRWHWTDPQSVHPTHPRWWASVSCPSVASHEQAKPISPLLLMASLQEGKRKNLSLSLKSTSSQTDLQKP